MFKWVLEEGCRKYIGTRVPDQEHEFCKVKDGWLYIFKGYAWDGCTPKIKLGPVVLGVWDGPILNSTGKQACYYPSLYHDCLIQYRIGTRKQADELFEVMLQAIEFEWAKTYALFVKTVTFLLRHGLKAGTSFAFLCLAAGCQSLPAVPVSPGNPLRILPFVRAVGGSAADIPVDTGPDYTWMYHVLAVAALAFALVTSYIAKRPTKSAIILSIAGIGISTWALWMGAIEDTANKFAPWVFGIFLLMGVVDVASKLYSRIKSRGDDEDVSNPR